MYVALGASLLGSSLVLSGCVDRPGLDDDGGGNGSTTSNGSASATAASMVTTNEPTTGGSTGSGSTDAADGSSDGAMTTVGFTCISGSDDPWHCSADAPPPSFECDLFLQDCPEGEKCMPWANDGSGVWNYTRCSPLDPMPSEIGESCTVEGSGVSGIDSCGLGAMCWDVDPTNVGECVAMCGGDEINPICADPDTSCAMHNDGALALCLPQCDPLLVDCGDPDDVCIPGPGGIWNCVPGVSRGVPVGQACGYGNSCEAGSVCARPEVFAACEEGAPGCCAPLCDLAEPTCPDGTTCQPWFPRGEAPPFYQDTGICSAIPMDPREDWVDFDTSPLVDAGS